MTPIEQTLWPIHLFMKCLLLILNDKNSEKTKFYRNVKLFFIFLLVITGIIASINMMRTFETTNGLDVANSIKAIAIIWSFQTSITLLYANYKIWNGL
jgi:hypothetical protein